MTGQFLTLPRAAPAILCSAAVSIALWFSFFVPSGLIEKSFADEQRALLSADSDKIDAVLLLDTSGSMLATDPQALRYEGAKLFVNLLRPGDRVAVIAFDETARVVSQFVAHEDEAATKTLQETVSKLPAAGQYTDLLSGVEAARDLIKQQKRPEASAIVVLLSDGKMDPNPKIGSAPFRSEQLLNSVLPELKAASVKINTLYFSDQADKQLLTEIALASEGASAFASSVDVIHKSFADLFLAVKKPQVVPLTGRGFSIDNDVKEATFYLNRATDQELVMINPSGKEIRSNINDSSIKWFVGQRFDVVTVITPEAGPWRVQGLASADGFATVLTNLKLVSDWPNSVTSGEPTLLQVRLNEGDKPVVLPEVSTNTLYGVQVIPTDKVSEPILEEPLFDDGTHGDKIAADGIFSLKINLENPGEYKMWVVAKGPTFDRRQQLPFRVKPPLIQIVVEQEGAEHGESQHEAGQHKAPESAPSEHAAEPAKTQADEPTDGHDASAHEKTPVTGAVLVRLSTEVLGFKNVQVSLTAVDEARKRYLIPIEKGHDATIYEVPMKAFPHDGIYELEATLKAEAKKRGSVNEKSRQVKVTVARGIDAPPITVLAIGEVAVAPPSPWPFGAGILVFNAAAAGILLTLLKKQQSAGELVLPAFVAPAAANEFIALLEQQLLQVELDLSDPALQGEPVAGATASPPPSSKDAAETGTVEPQPPEAAPTEGA